MFKAKIYVSEADMTCDEALLADMSRQFADTNKKICVTGYLYFSQGTFFQYIEGPDADIDTLMDKIRNDDRHKILREFEKPAIPSRLFPGWHMKYLTREFSPYVNFEHLIQLLFKSMDLKVGQVPDWEKKIWQTIEKLAEHQLHRKQLAQSQTLGRL